jgi:NitT/TauT family transport system ATP-binding protein
MNFSPSNKRLRLVATPAAKAEAAPGDIKIDGLRKIFRGKRSDTVALENIDLTVGKGEFMSIVGPSGCGKSTLMRLIAGLLPASGGKITIDGREVKGPYTDIGIVFQNSVLLEWRSIIGNVLLQIEMRDLKPIAQYRARAMELLSAVGLGGFANSYPFELSGGMQQRASIVRALIHDPPRLLMDEPFGALDALTREQMRIDLEDLWLATGKTVVFITHSIEEAVLLSDRVVVMSARPGTIDRIIDIPLPRPRGLAARQRPEFVKLCAEITQIFLNRGVLTNRSNLRTGTLGLTK